MREEPDPAVLYPDVAAHGSLAAALQAAAADQGLSLTMIATPSDLVRHATMPSVLPHREALFVSAWHFERKWWVSGSANNGLLISGTTPDLHLLPRVVLGWAEGASLGEIAQAAPFDVLTGRFEVPDGNPADVIAAEWQYTLKDAQQSDWPEYLALIEAAYAEPKLRRLYPYTSHWELSFSATPYPFTPSFATLVASRGGAYTVKEWWNGPALAQVTTPAETISIAVDRIPEGLGQGPPHQDR
ncbi:DUF6193 family natural product biosynthesis protein [Actinoplanes subglobosus]|uniref:DUF6193 family natural product biosynthesis protein n=1 Tax=Actinoplanes subglobosus TaxID=1547892 RepID=A0ABV8JA54_9ACTN